ncbi:MAG: MarR family transcriptional regulator [Rhodobacteraceae bacterium]|nr:MarR family transcriptional regulator [Paracoccaceae bacterium]
MTDDQSDDFESLTPEIRSMMGVMLLYWRLDEGFREKDQDLQLSKQEKHILLRLREPMRMGVLAKRMLQVPSSITASADALETKGYLTRSRDPDDRRAWLLSLTDLGWQVRTDIIEEAGTFFRDVSGLSDDETERFAELAGKIRTTILKTGIPEGLDI